MSFYKPGGFIILGRIVAKELTYKGVSFVIISDNLKHVWLTRKRGYNAYFDHLNKAPVSEVLRGEQALVLLRLIL